MHIDLKAVINSASIPALLCQMQDNRLAIIDANERMQQLLAKDDFLEKIKEAFLKNQTPQLTLVSGLKCCRQTINPSYCFLDNKRYCCGFRHQPTTVRLAIFAVD